MTDLTGRSIKGYELKERIGAGGFGAVYRASQSTVGREVAVKIILPTLANNPEFIRRFEIEAQLIARLEHLHIVPLYDYWRDSQGTYLVMRWLRGGSLKDALREGPLELEAASLLLDQVAAGLAAAHNQQIVHRDLKPSNILLDEEGNAYLADFGIARDLRQIEPFSDELGGKNGRKIAGSLEYLSPEQARGEGATCQSDIYSLGITLYEMLTGRHPFPELNSVQHLYKHINDPLPRIELADASISDSVNEVIQQATAKNPKRRFPDSLALSAAFRDAARLSRDGHTADLVESLTRREQEILRFIVEGYTNRQIAQSLFVELSTVKWHITQIYKKLGVRSRVQATVRARELNLIVDTEELELGEGQATGTSISVVLPEPTNPYKGLRAFEPADHRDFFGREALVKHLLERLSASEPLPSRIRNSKGEGRFLAIIGPSGSGKSSLVKAGLIPALWSGKLPGSEKWFIVDMMPGARPLDELEVALTRIAADQAGNLREHLDRDAHGLSRAASLILPNDDSELVVVIDQFEELFTLVEDEQMQAHFMDLINGAVIDPRSRVRVILTLRADYYDRPLRYQAFGELVRSHMETLLPLSAEELERAIVNPAQQVGVAFESGLVPTIIEDVNYRPATLPLLQYALTELFEQRQGRLLTAESYGVIGGATGALAGRAEDLYREQKEIGREAIHQMFLRLVTVNRQAATSSADDGQELLSTRRRVLRSELLSAAADAERLDDIIDTFAEYRLLSLDYHPATRQPTVEVAHEAILHEWDRLRQWLEASQADLSMHRQLGWATADWIESGCDESYLLRGSRLTHFESWADDTQLVLSQEENAYLNESLAARESREAIERERQEQEARLERRSNRRLRALVAVMAVALVVAIGLSITAVRFAGQAEEQRRLAVARELAAAAAANLASDPELSILLALEAGETTLSTHGTILPEVEVVLHQAVQADRVKSTFSINGPGAVAFSPDGRVLALYGFLANYGVRFLSLQDVSTGELVRMLGTHPEEVTDVAFSPDGQLLASSDTLALVKVWDVASGRELMHLWHVDWIYDVTFSPDNQYLATAGRDGMVRVWQMDAGLFGGAEPAQQSDPLLTLPVPDGYEPTGVAFSPDGRRLAAFVPALSLIVWDAISGEQLLELPGTNEFVAGIDFSPDGRFLAGGTGNLDATVWDATTGDQVFTLNDTSPIIDVDFSPDSHLLATAGENGTVALWDMETGREWLRLTGHSGRVHRVAFAPDGRHLVTGGRDFNVKVWDVSPTGSREQFTLAAHEGLVHDAVYSPDGSRIATAGEDGAIRVWNAADGALLLELPGQTGWVHFPVFSPDGKRLAAANREGGVSIWDAITGRELLALEGDAPAFTAINFSPDGSRVAAGGLEGIAHIWDAETGERLLTFRNSGNTIMELIYLEGEDSRIAFLDWDGRVTVWDATRGEPVCEVRVHSGIIWDGELSPDGRLLASASWSGVADVRQAECVMRLALHRLQGHAGNVTGVAFDHEGTVLATSGFDGSTRLWDMETGDELWTLASHTFPATGVDYSPDGRYLITAGSDGMVRVYVMAVEELMELARTRLSRSFTRDECRRYLHRPLCPEE